jgi:glycine cleavage system aminomethyltransferase T
VAMAYLESGVSALGTALEVVAGASRIPVRVVKRPFYTRGSRR